METLALPYFEVTTIHPAQITPTTTDTCNPNRTCPASPSPAQIKAHTATRHTTNTTTCQPKDHRNVRPHATHVLALFAFGWQHRGQSLRSCVPLNHVSLR